ELAIALDRDHLRARLRKRAREVTEARAQLDHGVAGPELRQPRQPVEDVRIAEKVLAPLLLRAQAVLAQKLGGRRQRRHPGSADISGPALSPRASRSAPAMAIIAPLSVHSFGLGRCRAIPSAAHRSA